MKKPYIFGHRGAMGYEIENTLESFEKSVAMHAGIETDVRLTKDGKLICFHDPGYEVGNIWNPIKKRTLAEINNVEFPDKRQILTVEDLFKYFISKNPTLRYSCDIGDKRAGIKLIEIANEFSILKYIEITDQKPRVFKHLRNYSKEANLVHTIPPEIVKVNETTVDFDNLRDLKINICNLKYERSKVENFKNVIDNGFKCYVWGVNSKTRMKKVLNLRYRDEIVEAIYTNFPDILYNLREEVFS